MGAGAPQPTPDRFTGEPRLVAPRRALRLGPQPAGCPFCPGNEQHTPAETLRIDAAGGAWAGRAFPNLYPLAAWHEVLVPTPRHVTSVRELTVGEWEVAVELWAARSSAIAQQVDEATHVQVFVNDGLRAGASIAHTHAQVVALPHTQPVARSLQHTSGPAAHCVACQLVDADDALVVGATGDWVLRAHDTPRAAHTLLVIPRRHDEPWPVAAAGFGPRLAQALHTAVRALPPDEDFNVLLAGDPRRDAHWYVELVPRIGYLAGLELATGITVAIASPAEAATQARQRLHDG